MTTEQIKEVEELASLHFTEGQISLISGIDSNNPDFKTAVQKGYLIRESKIRKSIFQLAENGSAQAQMLALKIMKTKKLLL